MTRARTMAALAGALALVVLLSAWSDRSRAAPGGNRQEDGQLAMDVRIMGVDGKPVDQPSAVTIWERVKDASAVSSHDYTSTDPRDGAIWRRVSGSIFGESGPTRNGKDRFLSGSHLPPGVYRVTALAGSRQEKMAGMAVSEPIRLDGSQKTTSVTISIQEGPPVTFAILDAKTNAPIRYPRPGIHLTRSDGFDVQWDPLNPNLYPGDDGTYRIEHLAPGSYQVDASARTGAYGYPDYRLEKPISIDVRGGEPKDTVLKMIAQPLAEAEAQKRWPWAVEGMVTDADGRPLEGVEIRAATGWGTLRSTMPVTSDASGRYLLRFGPGMMTKNEKTGRWGAGIQAASIFAANPGLAEKNLGRQGDLHMADEMPEKGSHWSREKIVLPGKPYRVNFTMVPAAVIQGQLVDEKGKPLAKQSIDLAGDELPPSSNVAASTTTDAEGRFRFDHVAPDFKWWFELGNAKDFSLPRTQPITLKPREECHVLLRVESRQDTGKMLRIGSLKDSQGHDILGKVVGDDPRARPFVDDTTAAKAHFQFWVAPSGDDAAPGTQEKPFATFARAQREARGKRATVWFRTGVYYLPETIRFSAQDNGTTYAAAPGEKPVLSGGMRLELRWEPYRGGILQARTPAGLSFDQLFINGQRQWMARYPDFDRNVRPYGGYAADAFDKARAAHWADPSGGFIHAMHSALWGGYHYRITGKKADGEVTYEGGWQNNRQMGMHPEYRYVENVFEELDAPGEWFHDVKTATLFYLPTAGSDLSTATVEVVRLRHLVEFAGTRQEPVKAVILRGFVFRHAARTFMDVKEPLLRSDWTIYRGGAVLLSGTEDCMLEDCEFDQVGGNAVFVNNYNRRVTIRGCDIHDTGASAVAFVGNPKAVRNPLFQYNERQDYADLSRTPGPQTEDYPADCLVEDCLIRRVGVVEKQATGVQLSMASGVTIRHCSIYEAPRAGININEGTFGGHRIEFCDVFDTVRETGDHGAFNSWGRDRYWGLKGAPVEELPQLALLDILRPNVIRNSRWRCDHGWDVDLDDGSSSYEIYNNLFLAGGLKLREGYGRKVWNNIAVNNTLHPHAWFENSNDVVTRNIWMGAYRPAAMPASAKRWGAEMDRNLFTTSDADRARYVAKGCDANSLVGDPLFVDPAHGDFRVRPGSPALALGFENFPMDQFGVQKPALKSMARTPEIPGQGQSVAH